MANEEIIKAITEEVMKKLNIILNNSTDSITLNRKAIILGENQEFNRGIYKSSGLIDYYTVDEIVDIDIDAYEVLLIEELKTVELASISLGLYERGKEEIIIEALLKGKKVGVLHEGLEFKKYKNTSNKNLYKLYSSYEEKMYNFGIDIVEVNDIDAFFKEVGEKKHIKEKELDRDEKSRGATLTLDLTSKHVVCESDLKKVTIKGYKSVKVNKNTIITPLAEELVKQNRLSIIRE